MRSRKSNRRGVALIMVMVLIVMVSLGAYSYTQLMTAQESSMVMTGRRLQAQAAVNSGVEYLKDYLVLDPELQADAGGHWDNAAYFQEVMVGGADNLRFSIISVSEDQYGEPIGIRYGLTDDSSKLNVNFLASEAYEASQSEEESEDISAEGGEESEGEEGDLAEEGSTSEIAREALMALPGMTELIADAILDWIDADDVPRDFGAEANDYSSYEPRNGPISSIDELLLVQGVTNELLYGADRNHNGILESNEQAEGLSSGNGSMARGWSAYITANSLDAVAQAEETIDLNQEDMQALYDELIAAGFEADFAAYVVAYRQSGPYTLEIPEDAPEDFELPMPQSITGRQPDLSQPGKTEVKSALDLLGTQVQGAFVVPNAEEPESVLVDSPYTDAASLATVLPLMMGQLSTGSELGGSQRVNTNHCPSAVVSGLPNLDPGVVQNIMQLQDRAGLSADENYLYPTWPLGVGAVSIEEMKQLLPFVGGSGRIFRAQVVGYSDVPGVYARAEVVIDASGDEPVVVSWRDLSHLGLGFTLETLTQ